MAWHCLSYLTTPDEHKLLACFVPSVQNLYTCNRFNDNAKTGLLQPKPYVLTSLCCFDCQASCCGSTCPVSGKSFFRGKPASAKLTLIITCVLCLSFTFRLPSSEIQRRDNPGPGVAGCSGEPKRFVQGSCLEAISGLLQEERRNEGDFLRTVWFNCW